MSDIWHNSLIAQDRFATTRKTAIDGVMTKQLGFFDRATSLHITTATDQVDAEQCHDAVNHAVTSVGLQAHGIPLSLVLVQLQAMAEMHLHLCTGFERDEVGFQGTVGNYLGGLGHSSGGAILLYGRL